MEAKELRIGNYLFIENPEFWPQESVHQLQNLYFALTGEELNVHL